MNANPGRRPRLSFNRARSLAAGGLVALLLGLAAFWTLRATPPAITRVRRVPTKPRTVENWPDSPWKNANLQARYVGDTACATCHGEIAETYRRHPMGRSMARLDDVPDLPADGTFEAGGSRLGVEGRRHKETRLDERGRVAGEVSAEVRYAVGSGSRAVSFLVENEGRLFQSPITWYSRTRAWGLSPGYDRVNSHFDREVVPGCLFCHANRVEPVPLATNLYEGPIGHGGLAIGCERCHGPGALHVEGGRKVDGRDVTIVNPRHLEPNLSEAVCEQCHLLGDQRVLRAGREPFDFRPGLPLTEFLAVFERAREGGKKFGGHVGQMRSSACFRGSDGRLGCASCHDPHAAPSGVERVAFYRERCLSCHETKGCALPEPERAKRQADGSCVACHMPAFPKTEITHVAATDHRVLRKPEAIDPGSTSPSRPVGSLVLAHADRLGPEALATFGRERGIALSVEGSMIPDARLRAEVVGQAESLLVASLAARPDDPAARLAHARVLRLQGRSREASAEYQSLLVSAPDHETALDEGASLAAELGDRTAALARSGRAVALNPWSAGLHERRARVLATDHQWPEAEREARESLRLDPFQPLPRVILIRRYLQGSDESSARRELEVMAGLNPKERPTLQAWFERQRVPATSPR